MNTKLRQALTQQVQRIVWRYKLSEQTINTPKTAKVEEIQVFELELKERAIHKPIVQLIDRAIPYPILFVFSHDGHHAYGIGLKTASERLYYYSEWDAEPEFDFRGITLERIYENLIKAFLSRTDTAEKALGEAVAADRQITALEREITALKTKIRAEPQFKYKAELHARLQDAKSRLSNLRLPRD